MGVGLVPTDDSGKTTLALINDANGQVVPIHVGSTVTGADGKTYAKLDVQASVTANPPTGVVSTNNSTSTPLTAGATFTGTSESILAYGSVSVQVFTDQNSAANGLVIEQSQDGTNWDTKAQYSVLANTPFQQTVNATGQYLQVKYTNGGTNQGTFRLQTIKEVNVSPSAGTANQRVNAQSGDFVAGSIVDLTTIITNTTGLATHSDLSTANTHLANIDSDSATLVSNTTGLATQTTAAAMKTDLDTLNSTVATAANQATANTSLSSIATNTSGTKTDLDNLNTAFGGQGDSPASSDTASASHMSFMKRLSARLTSILTALQGVLSIQQTDLTQTGTISAAQPVIGTPVANATVVFTVGQGQSSWKALLLAGTGGFTSGTTIVADESVDGGTTWVAMSFKVAGSTSAGTVQSVTGPGPIVLSGNAGSKAQIRIRCSVLNSTETVNVTMRSGAGTGDVGVIGTAAVNIQQYNGATVSVSNPQFTDGAAQQGPVNITTAGGASGGASPQFTGTCTASADNSITFASRVRTVQLHNQSAVNVPYEHDIAAVATSAYLAPGQLVYVDVHTTTIHVFPSNALPINAANGLIVRGWN